MEKENLEKKLEIKKEKKLEVKEKEKFEPVKKGKYTLKEVQKLEKLEIISILKKFVKYETNNSSLCFVNRCNEFIKDILNKEISLEKDFKLLTLDTYTNSGVYGGTSLNPRYSTFYFHFYMKPLSSYYVFKEDFDYFKSLYTLKGIKKESEEIKEISYNNAVRSASDREIPYDYDVKKKEIKADLGGKKIK